jgi:hypothetical protein
MTVSLNVNGLQETGENLEAHLLAFPCNRHFPFHGNRELAF